MPPWLIKYLTWFFVFIVCIIPACFGIYAVIKMILDALLT